MRRESDRQAETEGDDSEGGGGVMDDKPLILTLKLADYMRAEVQLHNGVYHFFFKDDDAGVYPTLLNGRDPEDTMFQGIYDYGLPPPHDAEDYAEYQNWLHDHGYKMDYEDD